MGNVITSGHQMTEIAMRDAKTTVLADSVRQLSDLVPVFKPIDDNYQIAKTFFAKSGSNIRAD